MSSTPLCKNEAAGYWEVIYEGQHIVVPFDDFNKAVHVEAMKYLDAHPTENTAQAHEGAHNAAWFALIDASNWTGKQWRQTDAQPAAHTAGTWRIDMDVQPMPSLDRDKLHTSQVEAGTLDGAKGEPFSDLDSNGDEAALERMAAYFYGLYHKAGEGTVQEARYGSIYSQILSTLTRREIAESVSHMEMQTDAIVHMLTASLTMITQLFASIDTTTTEGSTSTNAPHTPAATSEL